MGALFGSLFRYPLVAKVLLFCLQAHVAGHDAFVVSAYEWSAPASSQDALMSCTRRQGFSLLGIDAKLTGLGCAGLIDR